MKVLITTVVALNPGDAAILQGTVELLQRTFGPDVEVAAIDTRAHAAAPLYPWIRFIPSLFAERPRGWFVGKAMAAGYAHRVRRFDAWRYQMAGQLMRGPLPVLARVFANSAERAVLDEYLVADLIVASGGTYLVPAYNMEPQLLDYELIVALGCPFGTMPQSMGPFAGTRLSERFKNMFRKALFILVRDQTSRRHLLETGVPDALVHVVPDAAFAMRVPPEQCAAPTARTPEQIRVAVSVREWKRFAGGGDADASEARYLRGVADLVAWLVEQRGARVTMLSSCQGIPDYWTDDAVTAARVIAHLPPHVSASVTVDAQFRGPQELLEALATFDLVVATRMHVAILALCSNRAVLPIAYEFKTRDLFASLNLEWMVTPIEEATGEALRARAERLFAEWDDVGAVVRSGVQSLESRLEMAHEVVRATVQPSRFSSSQHSHVTQPGYSPSQ